ncbi:heparan-alpha-glucosaminide N-acetyltransferase domain-containing protein [uncultured Kiloniella sp.]|uniref:heparan-alpha-glucosaminide N-acetyltransferase domain-containing protein n=1 Tax=uncultured Kiloniella sp. TaxID=1133091 RepID=UPI00262F98B0|nr:heparan-alpha-glucosaminide N-acetyltransferase domain-containing protein [uncultured Kiloniella sp.]
MTTTTRLEGLDFARFIAFVGMVLVNFAVVMGVEGEGSFLATTFVGALEGRAAATFVVLAGIGLGLAASQNNNDLEANDYLVWLTTKRALFLLAIGLLNSLIFDADILHYYALYFFFGVFFIRMSSSGLIFSIIFLIVGFVIMLFTLDYDVGWDWKTYTYKNFWTLEGFITNLFFNGWHPVIPWLAFFLFGILLSRLSLDQAQTQLQLFIFGLIALLTVEGLSLFTLALLSGAEQDLLDIATTEPLPPMPFYMIAGMASACMVLAFSLWVSSLFAKSPRLSKIFGFKLSTQIGRQTLTLYVAHILFGMGTLEYLGLLDGQNASGTTDDAIIASGIFIFATGLYVWAYSKFFTRGPIENLMRLITR